MCITSSWRRSALVARRRRRRRGPPPRGDPTGARVALRRGVALTIAPDAISDPVRGGAPPVKRSHAEFGPRVGAKRILALLERRGIPATWFVPGHTLTT